MKRAGAVNRVCSGAACCWGHRRGTAAEKLRVSGIYALDPAARKLRLGRGLRQGLTRARIH